MIGKGFPGFMKNLVLCVYAVHMSQALLCLYICHQLNLNLPTSVAWFVQTLGLGMFALRFLIWPITDHTPSQEQKQQVLPIKPEEKDHCQMPVNTNMKPENAPTKQQQKHMSPYWTRYLCHICGSREHKV